MIASLIVFGGWIFWFTVVLLFIFEYQMVKREKGWESLWGLTIWLGLIAFFGNFSLGEIKAFILAKSSWWLFGKIAIGFIVCGVVWSIFRWTWRNAKRAREVERFVAEYLRSKNRSGNVIPDDLLEDWGTYVFGTAWLSDVKDRVAEARRASKVSDEKWLEILTLPDWEKYEYGVQRPLEEARQKFLAYYKVESVEIPEEMMPLWLRRIRDPLTLSYGNPRLAELSEEPDVLKNRKMLGLWMAWWFVDIVIFFFGDLINEIWLFLVHRLRGFLQRIAHYQYRNVRKNFRTPYIPPVTTDKVAETNEEV